MPKKVKGRRSNGVGIKAFIADGELHIFGTVGDSWDELDAKTIIQQVKDLGNIKELNVRINSGGGYVFEGLAIYNFLVALDVDVNVYIEGIAASMASVIAMAGDTVTMPENALLMIHNPWDVSVGDADQLRKDADMLDKVKSSLIDIYATRVDLTDDELAALMDEETWLTADEALAYGFIDAIIEPMQESIAASIDLSAYHLPDRLKAVAGLRPVITNATGTNGVPDDTLTIEGNSMPKDVKDDEKGMNPAAGNDVPSASNSVDTDALQKEAAEKAVKAERKRQNEIRKAVQAAKLDTDFAQSLIDDGIEINEARAMIIDKWADNGGPETRTGDAVQAGMHARDKAVEAFAQATLARAGKAQIDSSNPYRGYRLNEIARACAESAGINTAGMLPEEYIRAALNQSPRAAQTTSDFPVILENTLHKMVLEGFQSIRSTWDRVCRTGDVTDFRVWNRLVPGLMGNMDTVNEHGEYKNKPMPDAEKNTNQVVRRGNILEVTPEVIVNDDLGQITSMATGLGAIASRAIDRAVYTLLEANPTLSDSVALFHASHGNLAASGAAPTIALIDAAATAMAKQTAPGDDAEPLDIQPEIALVPRDLQGTFIELVNAEYNDDQNYNQRKPNRVRGIVSDIVSTVRLSSATAWYLFADPMEAPVLEVVFLNGQRAPQITQDTNFRTSGLAWKIELPFGVGAIDYRGVYKNPGA